MGILIVQVIIRYNFLLEYKKNPPKFSGLNNNYIKRYLGWIPYSKLQAPVSFPWENKEAAVRFKYVWVMEDLG